MLFIYFIYTWRDLRFKVDSERQIFLRIFSWQFSYSQSFARNLLRENHRRNTCRSSFWCLAQDTNPGFSSNKPTHSLLEHGDFISEKYQRIYNLLKVLCTVSVRHTILLSHKNTKLNAFVCVSDINRQASEIVYLTKTGQVFENVFSVSSKG